MSVLHRSIELLEPYDGKLSCTVLRGESARKGADLPDPVYVDNNQIVCSMNQMIYEKMKEKEMIDPAYITMLKEGGTLLLVYHLKNDKTHE